MLTKDCHLVLKDVAMATLRSTVFVCTTKYARRMMSNLQQQALVCEECGQFTTTDFGMDLACYLFESVMDLRVRTEQEKARRDAAAKVKSDILNMAKCSAMFYAKRMAEQSGSKNLDRQTQVEKARLDDQIPQYPGKAAAEAREALTDMNRGDSVSTGTTTMRDWYRADLLKKAEIEMEAYGKAGAGITMVVAVDPAHSDFVDATKYWAQMRDKYLYPTRREPKYVNDHHTTCECDECMAFSNTVYRPSTKHRKEEVETYNTRFRVFHKKEDVEISAPARPRGVEYWNPRKPASIEGKYAGYTTVSGPYGAYRLHVLETEHGMKGIAGVNLDELVAKHKPKNGQNICIRFEGTDTYGYYGEYKKFSLYFQVG